MTYSARIRARFLSLPLWVLALCLAICLPALLSSRAVAQAVPPATYPGGNGNPADQPLAGQTLGSSLTLNQGANAIAAENESFDRFGLGLQASGGAITNFFGSQTNPQTAGFAQFSGDFGVLLHNERTRYFAFYQPQYNVYPQYSQVNNFGQSVFQSITHRFTEHTGIEWDTTAARYLSLNEFLPQALGIGGIGIVVPTPAQLLLENSFEVTNAATVLHLRSLMSARMTFDATLTGAYFLLIPTDVPGVGSSTGSERLVTGGADLQLNYQWTARDTIGVEATPIYIDGLFPEGHNVAETVQGVYQRQLSPTLSMRIGAGPLFFQSSSPLFGSVRSTSYSLNASLSRAIRQSQFTLSYSRGILVNFLSPAVASNTIGFNTYMPLKRNWIVLGNANYAHDAGTSTYGSATVYGGAGQIAYQVTPKFQIFARYSLLSQSYGSVAGAPSYSFIRNQISSGIRFNLGNPITSNYTSGGVQ
jgi:hypothetical protein